MDTLDYFDQATLAILRGQGCSPEQALRLARDLVDRRGKFVEGLPSNPPLGLMPKQKTPSGLELGIPWPPVLPLRCTAGEDEG